MADGSDAGGGVIDMQACRGVVDRLIALEQRKQDLADDVKSVMEDAKAKGLVPATLRVLVAERLAEDKREKARRLRDDVDAIHDSLDGAA